MAAMPDVAERLRRGGRVAELGSHVGRSSIDLAREFPRAQVDAVSENQADIAAASSEESRAGLTGRVVFHVAPPVVAAGAGDDALVDAVYARAAGFSDRRTTS